MRAALIASCALLAPASVAAQELVDAEYVFFQPGTCRKLSYDGSDATKFCLGQMIDVEYRDGRSTYMFFISKEIRVGFSGLRRNQTEVSADEIIQSIDKVTLKKPGTKEFVSIPATGECRFSNPTKGPAPMVCRATTKDGVFEADFMSSGEAMGVVD